MNGLELVASTTDPAFTIDRKGVIRAWNPSAEEAFDLPAADVRGRQCWRVLKGQDSFGNDYCQGGCPLLKMALSGKPVHRCELFLRDANGGATPYSVGTLVFRGAKPIDPAIVHVLQKVLSERRADLRRAPHTPNHDRGRLTSRELEVLRLLAEGTRTPELARTLCISTSTARNHVQHILYKLHVHSRLGAVVSARKAGLL